MLRFPLGCVVVGVMLAGAGCGGGGAGGSSVPDSATSAPRSSVVYTTGSPFVKLLLGKDPPAGTTGAVLLPGRSAPVLLTDSTVAPESGSLAENDRFQSAIEGLPGDAAGTGYASGPWLQARLDEQLASAGLGKHVSGSLGTLEAAAAATTEVDGGYTVDGNVLARPTDELQAYQPTLPATLPATTTQLLSFSHLDVPLATLLANLGRIAPDISQQLSLAQAALGLSLEGDVLPALAGEGALVVLPEGNALVVALDSAGAQTLTTLLSRLRPILALANLGSMSPLDVPSGQGYQLDLKGRDEPLYVAVANGRFVLSTTTEALQALTSSSTGGALGDDATYSNTLDRADMPSEVVAFVYSAKSGPLLLYLEPGTDRYPVGGFIASG